MAGPTRHQDRVSRTGGSRHRDTRTDSSDDRPGAPETTRDRADGWGTLTETALQSKLNGLRSQMQTQSLKTYKNVSCSKRRGWGGCLFCVTEKTVELCIAM